MLTLNHFLILSPQFLLAVIFQNAQHVILVIGCYDFMHNPLYPACSEPFLTFRSVYYAATDVVILKFMIEVCWAPMLAAFSVPLDQSEDETVISLCLEGFRCAIHVTAVMTMKTQRDAFVTSLAKFTSLHSAADMKQKNIDAIKVWFLFLSLPNKWITTYITSFES